MPIQFVHRKCSKFNRKLIVWRYDITDVDDSIFTVRLVTQTTKCLNVIEFEYPMLGGHIKLDMTGPTQTDSCGLRLRLWHTPLALTPTMG